MDHGHPDAWDYPLAVVSDEAAMIRKRINTLSVTDAILLQHAAGSIMSTEMGEQFHALTKRIMTGD